MSKLRVHELARELNVESKALMARIKSAGIEVQSHQSTLSSDQIDKIKKLVGGNTSASTAVASKAGATASAPTTKVIRRQRRPADSETPVSAPSEGAIESASVETAPTMAAEAPPAQPAPSEVKAAPIAASVEVAPSPKPSSELKPTPPPTAPEPAAAVMATANSATETAPTETRRRTLTGGATIVRKATPEEAEASRAQSRDNFRDRRTLRKEDARGTRVTDPLGGMPQGMMARGGGAQGGTDTSRMPGAIPPPEGWEDDAATRRRIEKERRPEEEEESEAARKARVAKVKRAATFNARLLLNEVEKQVQEESFDPELELPIDAPIAPEAFQMKTVYTPSAPHRKKDLKRRKDLKRTQITTPRAAYRIVEMSEVITVADLARQMSVKAPEIIKKLMAQGMMVTLNHNLDVDSATLLANEYGFEVQNRVRTVEDIMGTTAASSDKSLLMERPPIVTIMGHVDHGKTSILDAIRQSNVAGGEAGGITQHIGAYTVDHNGKRIAFLDTPGHEAFSSMRARGASLTDIVILVVAADDGVMPQTIEAISHARAANVPIIVAINKIDKPNVNFDRVYRELSEHGVQSEEWGGENQFVKVSALKKMGLDELLEAILLQAEVLELKANPKARAEGVVIEAHLDAGRGPVATIMVKNGTLRSGEFIVAGMEMGRVRAMHDHRGKKVDQALPATPVEILGLSGVPLAGDPVNAVADEKTARDAVGLRLEKKRNAGGATSSAASLEDLLGKIKQSDAVEVPVIIKADTQGSLEAIAESITKLNTPKVANHIIHKAVGGVTESDVTLATTTKAIIIGFNVRAGRGLDEVAERAGVPVKYFSIIYEVVDTVKSLMAGQLPKIVKEVVLGRAEVRMLISVPKVGIVAGSAVTDGKIARGAHVRLIRDNIVIYTGKLGSLRRFKDDVKEVQSGYECGIGIEGYNDVRVGDVVEAFILEEEAATL